MASIWCCRVSVKLLDPMNVPGYPNSKNISVNVKVRSETEKEPSNESILAGAKKLMNACYPVNVLEVSNPQTDFLLWDKI